MSAVETWSETRTVAAGGDEPRLTLVVSTKRSAHHAFIRWLIENTRRPTLFVNNVMPTVPVRLARAVPFNGAVAPARPGRLVADPAAAAGADLILNFEGKLPESIDRFQRRCLAGPGAWPVRRLAFLRDPVNMLASLARRVERVDFDEGFRYFRQLLAFERIAAEAARGPATFAAVVPMTAWLRDGAFRLRLAAELDLLGADLPPQVTKQGGGSSFSGLAFDPRAAGNDLFERWRAVEDNPLFLAAFTDAQAIAAMRAYFFRFAHAEAVDHAVVERLAERAAQNSAAQRLARRYLAPLRRSMATLARMEGAGHPVVANAWRTAILLRSVLAIRRG